ncbi:MAG: hypothetical protein MUP66_01070 [Candidatus Nanohaloarchaeota archaeon QJJ-5]|nr:hypothetical protein [Candidatus Nanohaloarchaeota archaeon QJJ-5]
MTHRCMNCGNEYTEDDEELVEGCECGSNLFLYEKEGSSDDDPAQEAVDEDAVMQEIDEYLESIKDKEPGAGDTNIRFDLQSIRVLEEGVYEIDLKKLLDEVPLIVEVKDGNYHLHLASVFTQGEEKSLSLQDLDEVEELQ